MPITRKAARFKGSQGETDIMIDLQQIAAEEYRNCGLPAPQLFRGRHGTDIRGLNWISPEVKRHEPNNGHVAITQQQIAGWWEQAKSQAAAGAIPVLFYRQNRHPWRARMFGFVELDGGGRIRTPVDISYEAFQIWFREKVRASIARPIAPIANS